MDVLYNPIWHGHGGYGTGTNPTFFPGSEVHGNFGVHVCEKVKEIVSSGEGRTLDFRRTRRELLGQAQTQAN
jgi:hypothetical protein